MTGVAVGFASEVDDKPGPLQVYTLVLPVPFADRFTVPPAHIGPSFVGDAVGAVVIVTTVVAVHPVPIAYVITAVPGVSPVTTPEGSMLAFELLLAQVPPVAASVKVLVPPVHMIVVPEIGAEEDVTMIVTAARFAQPKILVIA